MSSLQPITDFDGKSRSSAVAGTAINDRRYGVPTEEETEGEEADHTLAILLANYELSARLASMVKATQLGGMTLREFLRDGDTVVSWMLRQPNCGKKTVKELLNIFNAYPRPSAVPPLPPPPEPPLAPTELAQLFAADTLSARLAHILRTTELGTTTLPEFFRSQMRIEIAILRTPNCGRKTLKELRGLVGMHARRQIKELGLDCESFGDEFAALVRAAPSITAEQERPPTSHNLRTLVEWHMGRLPGRTADVISRRFGLADTPRMTLAQIGDEYNITRERVRQIEAKGLKTVLTACRRFPLKPALDQAAPRLLDEVFGGDIYVTASAASRAIASFDGWHELAIQLTQGGGAEWLRREAKKLGGGWLAPGTDQGQVRAIAADLRSRSKGRPFPRAIDELVEGLNPCLARAAMALLLNWHVESGYVFSRRPGPRLRRTVMLHALLAHYRQPIEVAPLLRRYHSAVSADPCSDRDLVLVMEAATHLFLEIHEGYWATIGRAASPQAAQLESNANFAPDVIVGEEGTIAAALERELERAGPSRVGELMGRAIDILPEGRSRHSVGPTLLLNVTRFVRVLPGVYALPHQVLDGQDLVQAGAVGYLLNAVQARYYAIGRKAGESWGAFPLWTPTAEMRLCRWARTGNDRALYRSLLDVASIDEWPTDGADKEVWRDLRGRFGRYELWSTRRLNGARPPLDRVVAASIRLERNGTIGWVAANRIMGYAPLSYAGAGMLAGMVSAGIATEPAVEYGWQLPYLPGPRLEYWLDRLSADLHATGFIDWDEGTGANLASTFLTPGNSEDLAVDDLEEMDEYERLMAEHRLSVQARRIEARMALEAE